jgi:hypothetical protein
MIVYKPKPGFTHNPLLNNIGRNDACPCGSGKKYKKCCLGLMMRYIPVYTAEKMKGKPIEKQIDIFTEYVKDFNHANSK